jgi:hypothetical protein
MVLDADFSPIEDDDDLLLEDEGSPLEELPPEPTSRRPEPRETEGRGRGRRGGRGRQQRDRDAGDGRRDRDRPPTPQPEGRYDEPAELELDDHEDDLGEESGGHPAHKKIPTWEEAIGVLVDANLASRSKSPDRDRGGRGSRGRGRGGR